MKQKYKQTNKQTNKQKQRQKTEQKIKGLGEEKSFLAIFSTRRYSRKYRNFRLSSTDLRPALPLSFGVPAFICKNFFVAYLYCLFVL